MTEEQTVFKGSPSAAIYLGTFLLCAIAFGAILAGGFFLPNDQYRLFVLLLLILPICIALYKFILLKCLVYEITTVRIKISEGLFSKRTEEIELYRVKDTTLVEPALLRLFSAGNIVVNTADASSANLVLRGIKQAGEVRETLRKNVELCRDRKRTRVTELE